VPLPAHLPVEGDDADGPTYYGLPLLQEPVWKPFVPLYYWLGGGAGAAALLSLVAGTLGGRPLARLARRGRQLAAAGDIVGSALLVADLGRPTRFLNMLRVFRPSSPMSVGSWVLSTSGAANSVRRALRRPPRLFGALGKLGGVVGGLLGMPLAGYTAVLVANTAVPVWLATRRSLPLLFMSSGVATAGCALSLTARTRPERRVATTFAVAGQLAELAATAAMHVEAGAVERVARPLRRGRSGALFGVAALLTTASLVTALVARRRPARTVGALLGLAGTLALRLAVHEAGKASARDPRASFAAAAAAEAESSTLVTNAAMPYASRA
jgi:formate-dependent nitrite reductase membrane component NrfD